MPLPEPWLRGTEAEVPAVARAVLHALELANEDLLKWCFQLSDDELNAHPAGLPPVSFQLRHIARSVDRLLTYVEDKQLTAQQTTLLHAELEPRATKIRLQAEVNQSLEDAANRVRALAHLNPEIVRYVGKDRLPTTLGGLMVHIADHTQRHVGQAVTTSRVVRAATSGSFRE
jgi:uncharacterized damage-inducible protein DinB